MIAGASDTPMPGMSSAPKVLVVEDEVLVRAALAQHLRSSGFVVLEAVTYEEAVTLLKAEPFIDAVFADVRLPGAQSGLDLTLLIQRDYPTVKVLLTSGVIRSEETSLANVTLIRKPYFLFEVERRIRALIADP